jgi:hypothetical protein
VLYSLTGEVPGTGVQLPNAQTFSFAEAEAFDTLRGDDAIVAIHGKGPQINWELGHGGVSLQALQTMNGGTITTTGTGATMKTTYAKGSLDVRPYFKVEGQAISDSGGDFHVVVYRCRATSDVKGDMKDSTFWVTDVKGEAIGRTSDNALYEFVENATVTPIAG